MSKHIILFAVISIIASACGSEVSATVPSGTQETTRGSLKQGSPESGDLVVVMPDGTLVPYPTSVQVVAACVSDGTLKIELHNIAKVAGQFKLEVNGVKMPYTAIEAQATIYMEVDVAAADAYTVLVLSDHTSIGGSAEQQTNAWNSVTSSNACP